MCLRSEFPREPAGDTPQQTPSLVLRRGIAVVDRVHSDELRDALASVPGTIVSVVGRSAWAARIGPEGARSVARIVDRLGLVCDAESRLALGVLAAGRDAVRPLVGLIQGARARFSVLDEPLPGVEGFRSIPGARIRRAAGTIEVQATETTAVAVAACVDAFGMRLSPSAEHALRDLLEAPSSPPTGGYAAHADTSPASVTMHASDAYLQLTAREQNDLARAFARLPGSRMLDRTLRQWLLPATTEATHALRALLHSGIPVTVDQASEAWLALAPRWSAHIGVERSSEGARLVMGTRSGAPPKTVEMLDGLSTVGNAVTARLTVTNLGLLVAMRDSGCELAFDDAAARALDWLATNPDRPTIPAAELDVEREDGVTRFVLEPIWDLDLEPAFLAQEARLMRDHRLEHPEAWVLPAAAWSAGELARFVRVNGIDCSDTAAALLKAASAADSALQRLISLSLGTDAALTVEGLDGELMPFQRAGVAYALERRRVLIADEQGLGKTVQALATVQADGAYPAIVICPASLKLNWLREARRWLPARTARELSGRAGQDLAGADILVLNYEIAASHADALIALVPRALILDESHYVKSPTAQRTRAVIELAERLAPDALRLALTGTPVVNRPAELIPQLRALGRLQEYGSARSFEHRYATVSARRSLHMRLRGSCYVRRTKRDVLPQLPEKRRAVVSVPLANEREYRQAEAGFITWLLEQIEPTGSAVLPETIRAIALVRLTALRRLAARGKLDAAISWIEDFRQSEERLVVFAHHREIQHALLDRFPDSARILGTDRLEEREANVRRFQADDGPSLCVASLEVASHGFTLTAAVNVAFLELAWTPAKHDQAEDRLHRIGQERSVTAWYLLAADTIDERIAQLLEDKRHVVDSLTDGGEGVSSTLVDALVTGYVTGAPLRRC